MEFEDKDEDEVDRQDEVEEVDASDIQKVMSNQDAVDIQDPSTLDFTLSCFMNTSKYRKLKEIQTAKTVQLEQDDDDLAKKKRLVETFREYVYGHREFENDELLEAFNRLIYLMNM